MLVLLLAQSVNSLISAYLILKRLTEEHGALDIFLVPLTVMLCSQGMKCNFSKPWQRSSAVALHAAFTNGAGGTSALAVY